MVMCAKCHKLSQCSVIALILTLDSSTALVKTIYVCSEAPNLYRTLGTVL